MRIARLVVCALLLLSVAAYATPAPTPNPAPLSDAALAAILGAPLGATACAKPQPAARYGGLNLKAFCEVQCDSGSVSCTGNPTCTAVNRDCSSLEPGHVTCNGVTTNCTPGCCTTGTMHDKQCCRCEATGNCFDCCRCDGGTIGQCAMACG
jgi:hypothetical protein